MMECSIREKPEKRPGRHVVLLGAGASRATCLSGDKCGRVLPLMNELADVLGEEWQHVIEQAEAPDGNFEEQYSWLKAHANDSNELRSIEAHLQDYFGELELPDAPTIYDYLVLGLRSSDVIATFNWDPLLLQAYDRNRGVCDLPDIRFLHGCVSYATCHEHDVLGLSGMICPKCKHPLEVGALIYPEAQKDYTRHSFIKRDWDIVQTAIQASFHLTIFGYRAPITDFNARRLLLDAWGDEESRGSCHVEFIDTASSDSLADNWKDFIPYGHMMYFETFYDSSIARWPRRTFEWKIRASTYGLPSEDVGICKTNDLRELQAWFTELAAHEKSA